MNLEVLLETYKKDPRIFAIADRIVLSTPQHLHLAGLRGSASQFVATAIFTNSIASQLNHLIILRDAEEAAYFQNTFENLTNGLNIFYFPSSFKNKKNFRLLNSSHVMLRTECLTKFVAPRGQRVGAIVTYPEALCEKVVLSKTLSSNIISIKQGDVLDVQTMLEKFVAQGFE